MTRHSKHNSLEGQLQGDLRRFFAGMYPCGQYFSMNDLPVGVGFTPTRPIELQRHSPSRVLSKPSLTDTCNIDHNSSEVGTSLSASAIDCFLSVDHRERVLSGEEAINRGRAQAGPYPGKNLLAKNVSEGELPGPGGGEPHPYWKAPLNCIDPGLAARYVPLVAIVVLVLVALLFPFSHASAHASATGNGRISGQLLNGSRKNAPIAGQIVTLQMSQDSSARDLAKTTTDAHGAYTFANLTTDSAISYAVYINFQGAQYISAIVTLDKKPMQQVNLTVYDATTSTKNLAILRSTVLVGAPDTRSSTFSVSELFDFSNLGLQSFVGSLDASQGKPNALFFSLPKNARNVKLDTGFTGYQAIQETGGFATNAAVLPGENAFSLSFDVPYTSSVYDFSYDAMYPTVDLSFMVAPSIHASSGALSAQGLITANQHTYQLFKGNQLLMNQEVHVSFEGLPSPASSSSPLDLKYVWLIVGVLILLAIIAVASALSRLQDGKRKRRKGSKSASSKGRREEKKPAAASSPTDRKQELMYELLELDKAYEAGKLSKTAYQERRARTKARLRTLMSEREASRR